MITGDLDKRQQITEAAQRAFARYGFDKATIKVIACEAGLKSPALIYWYFKDKDELFQAVVTKVSLEIIETSDSAALMALPPEGVLSRIAMRILAAFDDPDVAQLLRIFISEAAKMPEVGIQIAQRAVLVMLNFLAAYFEHQVSIARFRSHDAQSAARAFMGTLVAYVISRELYPPLRADLPSTERYVREVVTIFINGLRAEGGTKA